MRARSLITFGIVAVALLVTSADWDWPVWAGRGPSTRIGLLAYESFQAGRHRPEVPPDTLVSARDQGSSLRRHARSRSCDRDPVRDSQG
jgi:hypothetical protein